MLTEDMASSEVDLQMLRMQKVLDFVKEIESELQRLSA
jgi:hypothetical protein